MSYHDERMSGGDAATVIHNYDEYGESSQRFVTRKGFRFANSKYRIKKVWREHLQPICLGTGLVILGLTFGLFWGLFMPIVGSYILWRAKLIYSHAARAAGIYGAGLAIGWIIYLRWFI